MTRKKAISKAIELLKNNSENEEVISKLQEILGEMPMYQWTKESVIDALEEYVSENGYLPSTTSLLNENGLPSRITIETKFNITSIAEFYEDNFPEYYLKENDYASPYKYWSEEMFIKTFKENYERIKNEFHVRKVPSRLYDNNREPNTPLYNTIVKNCKCKSYREFLVKCGYERPRLSISAQSQTTYCDNENANDELRSMVLDIQRDVNNRKK